MSQDQPIVLDPTYASFDAAARPADLGATHFIGIGGAGMSVLAEMLHAEGVAVDGSDRAHSAKTDRLETLGITVEFGQRAENVAQAETVVYSSAIKPDNPEIVAAHAAGKRIVHRSDILALLMNGKRAVTVAGAHGKTTTSSMLSHILVNAGADPSYAIGGFIQGPDGTTLDGGHAGKGDILVAEADESDGSFAKYHPTIAIITNCEADHLDHYGDEAHYRAAFVAHAGRARRRRGWDWLGRRRHRSRLAGHHQGGDLVAVGDFDGDVHRNRPGLRVKQQRKADNAHQHQHGRADQPVAGAPPHHVDAFGLGCACALGRPLGRRLLTLTGPAKLEKCHGVNDAFGA